MEGKMDLTSGLDSRGSHRGALAMVYGVKGGNQNEEGQICGYYEKNRESMCWIPVKNDLLWASCGLIHARKVLFSGLLTNRCILGILIQDGGRRCQKYSHVANFFSFFTKTTEF